MAGNIERAVGRDATRRRDAAVAGQPQASAAHDDGAAGVTVAARQLLRAACNRHTAGAADAAVEAIGRCRQDQTVAAQRHRAGTAEGTDRGGAGVAGDVEHAVVRHAAGARHAAVADQPQRRAARDGGAAGIGVGSGQPLRTARDRDAAAPADAAVEAIGRRRQDQPVRPQRHRAVARHRPQRHVAIVAAGVQRTADRDRLRVADAAVTAQRQRTAGDRRRAGIGLRRGHRQVAGAGFRHRTGAADRADVGAVSGLVERDRRIVDDIALQRGGRADQRAAADRRAARIAVRSGQRQRAAAGLGQPARCAGSVGDRAVERQVIGAGVDRAAGIADGEVRPQRHRRGGGQRTAVEHRRHCARDQLRIGIGRTRAADIGYRGGAATGQRDHRRIGGNAVQLERGEDQHAARAKGFTAAIRYQRDAVETVAVVDRGDEMLLAADRRADPADQQRGGAVEHHVDLRRIGGAAAGHRIAGGAARAPVRHVKAHGIDIICRGARSIREERERVTGSDRRVEVARGVADAPVGEAVTPFVAVAVVRRGRSAARRRDIDGGAAIGDREIGARGVGQVDPEDRGTLRRAGIGGVIGSVGGGGGVAEGLLTGDKIGVKEDGRRRMGGHRAGHDGRDQCGCRNGTAQAGLGRRVTATRSAMKTLHIPPEDCGTASGP